MPNRFVRLGLVTMLAVATSGVPAATPPTAMAAASGPSLESFGPLAFGPDGVLFAADPQAAAILALDVSGFAKGAAAGTQAVSNLDQKIAALLGTDAAAISMTDLVVHPTTRHTYVSVMRGQGAEAAAGARAASTAPEVWRSSRWPRRSSPASRCRTHPSPTLATVAIRVRSRSPTWPSWTGG